MMELLGQQDPSLALGRGPATGTGTNYRWFICRRRSCILLTAATEEFTGETVSANIKTFTTS